MQLKVVHTFAAAVVLALLPAGAGAADDDESGLTFDRGLARPVERAAAPAEQLVGATASFGTRAAGMPAAGSAPHQQLVPGASVQIDYGHHWESGAVTYYFSMTPSVTASRPDDGIPTLAGIGFGILNETTCTVDTVDFDDVSRFRTDLLLYGSGDATETPNAGRWDCAVLFTTGVDAGSPTYDAFVSPLVVSTARPQITISAPRKDRLVRNVWTEVTVEVANAATSQVSARDVAVTGTGKGVKVRSDEVGALDAGDDSEAQLWVKLTKKKGSVKFTATEVGQPVATTSTKVAQRPVPAPPKAGKWSDGSTTFSVSGGKLKGFRITAQTTCGGFPDLPTITTNNYDFPTVAIPRNNEVIKGDRGNVGSDAEYSVSLRVEFMSPTKAKGTFSYYGPARCRATESFTARRR